MKNREALSFEDVLRATFTTSAGADEACDEFCRRRLGLPGRNYAARLALARSLSVTSPPPVVDDASGRVIRGQNLFGEDLRTWVSLFVEHGPSPSIGLVELQDLVRRHWARGARLLEDDWTAAAEDHDRFILRLAQLAGLKGTDTGSGIDSKTTHVFTARAVPVRLPLGPVSRRVDNDEDVFFPVNGAGNSPHIAIMGTLGTGKTRVAKTMMAEAHRQSGCPVIVFDPKGDLASDKSFVDSIHATVVKLPKTPVPLDVLNAGTSTKEARAAMSMRFRESFARVPQGGRLGDVQAALVGEAVDLALAGKSPVTLSHVQDRLKELYAARKRRDDVVTTTFADMTRLTLFEPKMTPAEFFSRSWIIDLHDQYVSDSARRLIAFLLFDAAALHLLSQPDSEVDKEFNRALRLMLVVDEARKVLEYEHESFIELIRMSRSKGGVVMTISQSPDDFLGQKENFLENIGLGVVLRTNAKPNAVSAMLGASPDLSGLENGVCYTRLVGQPATRVVTWKND